MPSKDCFQVGQKFLKNANYYLSLNEDCYIAAYQERVLIGHVEDFDQDMAKFNKKAIVIPSNVYFEIVNTIRKGKESFDKDSMDCWEEVIYRHSKVHHIVGKYEHWDDTDPDSEMVLKLIIKWNHKNDRSWNKLVEEGLKDPINTEKLAEKDWLYLKRGVFLSKAQVDMIYYNLDTILQYSYYNQDSKKIVNQFIDFVLGKEKLKTFVKEKLKDYEGMNYQSKMKLVKDLLTEMFQDKKNENGETYQMKTILDTLSNKVQLIFSLLNYHLKQ